MRFQAWHPRFGAVPHRDGTRFCVFAPSAASVDVAVEYPRRQIAPLTRRRDGTFSGWITGLGAGARYRYVLDGGPSYPDPASRSQPDGVHGASETVDPSAFAWSDSQWLGIPQGREVFYELHVGTFTDAGTFDGVRERLGDLARLGITTIELMPVADFPGVRNWGYDGVALFAPARCYGRPDDLRRLVDAAHGAGLAVCLDVVYNHLGPEGAFAAVFAPEFVATPHGAWGSTFNLDGPCSSIVRHFLIENALHWVHEYHVDALRLDATHAVADRNSPHFLAELAAEVHRARLTPQVRVIAEDNRNLATIVRPPEEGGWNLDGVWPDDFHHEIRRLLAGDRHGYHRDYRGTADDLATILTRGWLYTGQHSVHFDGPRGTDPSGVPLCKFVACLQNHDQVGNRPFGDRLHHQIDLAAWRAATAVLLLAPLTPLIFMGQEWVAGNPFLFFTDHNPMLGRTVADSRRQEHGTFPASSEAEALRRIPDPQDPATFAASRLRWSEREQEPHASMLRLYMALLSLRHGERLLAGEAGCRFIASAPDSETVLLAWGGGGEAALLLVARLRGSGTVSLGEQGHGGGGTRTEGPAWEVILTTEDPGFSPKPRPPHLGGARETARVEFLGPAAVVLNRVGVS